MQTEAFFTDIRSVLLRELGLARQSILVAVAWFTDRRLFEALLARQRAGVAVSLCLTQDEQHINFRLGGLPFKELEAAGGRVWVVEDSLMHHKFCVLDGRDVLTGSYNWTNKAAQSNQENVVLTTGDPELAQRFEREFRRLTQQPEPATGDLAMERTLKRLGLIKSMLALHETEDLPKHVERLEMEGITDARLSAVLVALRNQRYADAVAQLEEFVAAYAQVRVWEDPQVPALQLEIRLLEAELLALDEERSEAFRKLLAFELWHQHELGELLQQVLGLRRDTARVRRQESAYSESEYQEAKRRYEEQVRDREAAEAVAAHIYVLEAPDQATLKQQYREAAQLCHPDRVAEEQRETATASFQRLQDAYQRQDLGAVTTLLEELRQGVFAAAGVVLTTVTHLRTRRDVLAARHRELLQELAALRGNEAYELAIANEAMRATYLAEHRVALTIERERLTALLARQQQAAAER
jgi:hypothetical protein